MGKLIIVASLKGGVGKTTVTAGLASKISDMGYKTLAIDMDFGIRALDIALGFEGNTGPNSYDVMMGRASLQVACVKSEKHKNLDFLSAPMGENPQSEGFSLPQKRLHAFLKNVLEEYDYVFLDMSAGAGRLLSQTVRTGLVSRALVVCTHNSASIRACEKLASDLYENGVENIHLIINSFLFWRAEKHADAGVVDIINRSSTPLIGVVPFEEAVEGMVSLGVAVTDNKKSAAGRALANIAKRLLGESVPLFDGVLPKKDRLSIY